MRFAWPVHESCWGLSVSQALGRGISCNDFRRFLVLEILYLFVRSVLRGLCSKSIVNYMGSKGNVKEFFGMRFAWPVHESCWGLSVSQALSRGISCNDFRRFFKGGFLRPCAEVFFMLSEGAVRGFRKWFIVFQGHAEGAGAGRGVFYVVGRRCSRLSEVVCRYPRPCAGDSIPFRAFRLARLVQKPSKLWVPKVT